MPVEFTVTYTPSFTLFGDGTVIWRDDQQMPPESSDNLMRATPLLIARLDEATIQALLSEAIGPGGLGVAVGPYNEMQGADIPSTVFTIDAGDIKEPKRVEVVGLSPEMHPKNLQVITALAGLAEKLRTFATIVNEQPYVPAAYRGILIPTEQAFGPVVDWPWTDISPDDFGGDNEFFRNHDLTPARSPSSASTISPAASAASPSRTATTSTASPSAPFSRTSSAKQRLVSSVAFALYLLLDGD